MLQYDSPSFNFSGQKADGLQPFFTTKKRHESFCKDTEAVEIDHFSLASTVETASQSSTGNRLSNVLTNYDDEIANINVNEIDPLMTVSH